MKPLTRKAEIVDAARELLDALERMYTGDFMLSTNVCNAQHRLRQLPEFSRAVTTDEYDKPQRRSES